MPSGYKDSPLGVIPQEWEVKRLGEVAKKIGSGVTPKGGEAVYQEQGRYFIRSQNVGWGHLLLDDVAFIDEATHNRQIATELQDKDILLNITGASIGRSTIVTNEIVGGNVNQHVCIIRLKNGVEAHFVCSYLLSDIGQRLIDSYQAGGNRQGLNFEQIKSFIIPLPPLAEQRRIAEILGTWDRAIERQGRKVALLQSRKRAIMQRLLTPKPHWQKTKLGGIAERVARKNTENNTNVMTISAQRGFICQTDFFNKSIASETLDNYFLVHKDEFCYNKSYCNGYPMGAIKRLNNADKAVVTTLYICFRIKTDKYNIEFFEQYFEAGLLNRHLMKIANEGGRAHGLLNVTPSDFFAMMIDIPSLAEQKSVAEKLSTADEEIGLARRHLDLLRSQKRALMQQLLTGKKRLQ